MADHDWDEYSSDVQYPVLARLELDEGVVAEIRSEEYIEDWMNPRDCDGLLGVMAIDYNGYTLGGGSEDLEYVPDFEIECPRCKGENEDPERWEMYRGYGKIASGTESSMQSELDVLTARGEAEGVRIEPAYCLACEGEGVKAVDPVTWAKKTHGSKVVLGLTIYEHSGITMKAHRLDARPGYPYDCPWDSTLAGIYFDTKESREECGCEDWDEAKIEESMFAEIKCYDAYLQGSCVYYNVENADGEAVGGCGGYLITDDEDMKHVKSEAEGEAEHAVESAQKEKREQQYWNEREVMTVG